MYKIIGVNNRAYRANNMDGFVEIKTVLVEGVIGDYAAYSGQGTDEWVAAHGSKISFAEANVQFYGLKLEKYRE